MILRRKLWKTNCLESKGLKCKCNFINIIAAYASDIKKSEQNRLKSCCPNCFDSRVVLLWPQGHDGSTVYRIGKSC